MTKKFVLAAMGAALVGTAYAQAPVLNHVKTINVPVIGNDVLANHFITDAKADGATLFYTGSGNAVNSPAETPLVKVLDWTKPLTATDHSVIFRDNNGVPGNGGALGQWQVQLTLHGGNVYFATSLGSTNTSRNGTEIYRLDYNGNLVFSAAGNFFDGVLNQTPVQEFPSTLGGSPMRDFDIDPGFGSTPTPRLAHVLGNTRAVRRNTLTDGNVPPNNLLGHNVNLPSMQSIAFDPAGNLFIVNANDLWRATRNAADGTTFLGFDDPTVIVDQTNDTGTWPQVEFIPGDGVVDDFVMVSNHSTPTGTGSFRLVRASDGSSAGYPAPFAGTPTGDFVSRVLGFATTQIGTTRYIFVTNRKAAGNAIDVYQIGNEGQITLNVSLNNFAGAYGAFDAPVEIYSADGSTLLDRKTVSINPASGSATVYTTARGPVLVSFKPLGFIRKNVATTVGTTPASVTIAVDGGDINRDRIVDGNDINVILGAFGEEPTSVNNADVNGDGIVDGNDINQVLAQFGAEDDVAP